MAIDDNKEAMAMMRRALGSIENRIREAYNKGYHDGLKEGINQTTKKLVEKILEEVEADRKTEPQTDAATHRFVEWENGERTCERDGDDYCKDEPQTERSIE